MQYTHTHTKPLFIFYLFKQGKLCLERKNGIFSLQETGSIRMGQGRTGQLLRVFGRPRGLINRYLLRLERRVLESRKLLCSTKDALRKDTRQIGSCMNTDYPIPSLGHPSEKDL